MTRPEFAGRTSAAKRIGISLAEYMAQRAAGRRWCFEGRHWGEPDAFYASRQTGCRACHYARVVASTQARRQVAPARPTADAMTTTRRLRCSR